ncbi:hypothetical protein L1987_19222 [Smallanthus sonchifolius]|uniref:Uncharacterized protein n=1 Tax=Smallanthus sonchifolius TaxID=185202 RepID=A0ACB9IQ61_9ASTR|nr:hypothetical protein L1987_19222 [Smallanthus sonchifolius]
MDVLVEKDFDISARAGGAMKAYVKTYTVNVTTSLEIRLYWAGKGTLNIPTRGNYGPLISAISVDPNFGLLKNENGVSRRNVAVILVGAASASILILVVLWRCGFLCHRDTMELDLHGLELNTGSFTLRQIKIATNNFDVANKIGEGGFGSVYKFNAIITLQESLFFTSFSGYMAPEYAMRGYLTDKADVYSYGIVLLEIVSGMANLADRANENQFVLLDRAIALKATGNLMDLVDPKLGSEYDIPEMMVVINLALLCTAISPTNRPTMSWVVSMLEGRIVPKTFIAEQSVSMTEMDHHKMMKQLESMNEKQMEEIMPFTDSSTSAANLYPEDRFSEHLQKSESDSKKLLSLTE